MKIKIPILLLFTGLSLSAQVGINTTDPKATLDVASENPDAPEATEGVLIPHYNSFPTENPTADQDGMLIFLTTDQEISSGDDSETLNYIRGYYYWSNPLQDWIRVTTKENRTFKVMQTFASPTSIEENVFRQGTVSIGGEDGSAQLSTIVNNSTQNLTSKPRKSLLVLNNHPSTGSSYVTYGIDVENASTVNGATYGVRIRNITGTQNSKYGIYNQVTAPGSGIHYGIFNSTAQNGTSTADMYGIRNEVGRTYGVSSSNYGIYNSIGSSTSAGTIYGLYSEAIGNSSATVYAGYFVGNVSIGTTNTNQYILPASRGNAGDILVAGANGTTSWQSTSAQSFTTVTTNTTSLNLNTGMSTVRVTASVGSINLPAANQMQGKSYTLINASTNSIDLTTADTSVVYDDVPQAEVLALGTNQRISVQSDGTNWVVIGN